MNIHAQLLRNPSTDRAPRSRTIRRAARTTLVALAVIGIGALTIVSSALAHEVPNEQNWHIHDGTGGGPLAGDHHAGLGFWPRLFSQEGLAYGTAEAPFVRCPNATDKVFLPNGVHGAVDGAGICLNDVFIVHLLSGVDTPEGWSTLTFPNGTFLSYELTSRG
jgi:hypothetical protein